MSDKIESLVSIENSESTMEKMIRDSVVIETLPYIVPKTPEHNPKITINNTTSLTSMVDYNKKLFVQTVINEAEILYECKFTDREGNLRKVCYDGKNYVLHENDFHGVAYSKFDIYRRLLWLC